MKIKNAMHTSFWILMSSCLSSVGFFFLSHSASSGEKYISLVVKRNHCLAALLRKFKCKFVTETDALILSVKKGVLVMQTI